MKSLLLLAYSKNTLMNNLKITKLVDRFSEGGNFFTLIKVQKLAKGAMSLGNCYIKRHMLLIGRVHSK